MARLGFIWLADRILRQQRGTCSVAFSSLITPEDNPMPDPRESQTNAADSAPGVNDGPSSAQGAEVPYHPKGRKFVWILLAGLIAIAVVVLVAKPEGTSRDNASPAVAPDAAAVGSGATSAQPTLPGGPAGQTPAYGQPGGAGETEVYSAPGKTPGASEDAPGMETSGVDTETR